MASIGFNLALIVLGLSTPQLDFWSDFTVNRLPNVIFILAQLPLFFIYFHRNFLDALLGRPGKGGRIISYN